MLLRNHDLDPHRCALVDDMLENLRAANRLGMSTVWVSAARRRVPYVDLRVASVTELPRLVFRYRGSLDLLPMPRAKGERKLEILKALAQMLEAPKWERITTAALAAKLDVSEAALYRHFASKAQMYEGLIEFIESSVFTLANKITDGRVRRRAARPRSWSRCCSPSPRRTPAWCA